MTNTTSHIDRDDADLPLRTIYDKGRQLYDKLEESELGTSDPAFQADVNKAIQLFDRCQSLVRTLNIFSTNEFLEDINTADLRYLLVDAYLGELHLKRTEAPTDTTASPSQTRLNILSATKSHLNRFLETCETHEITKPEDKKYYDMEIKGLVKDADRRRNMKIERHKRERGIKEKLRELTSQMAAQSTATSSSVDEELDRDLILTTLDLFVQKVIDSLKSVQDEEVMLEHMAKLEQARASGDEGTTRVEVRRPARRQVNPGGPILAADGKPLQPFVLLSQREALRQQVFRPGHNLPTMTIEQYLDNEIARGNFLSGGTEPPEKPITDDDEVATDAETYKARNWDEFKEANAKGWGNRMNKG
ncbi:hypothetical protein HK097_010134 [Rhizophlyctis rosea]|uniref:TAP42-like protein n=1 Tax=Rhizophlyctis rosea TaxID=64517 RepID=A0AAD5SAD1_9FUNG|nr:hypothetical protein HK097_010134 [Rhizophlyctis rosea]